MFLKNTCLKTGAYILIDSLIQNGVQTIFGYPGGAILPIYDELFHWEKNNLIKHILVRHEQSAAHAADAYSRSTNKVGVCFATSGPGATNLVTGIATAKLDSIPMIIITGQVSRPFIGTDAFQEIDIFKITLPIVKFSYIIKDINLLPEIIAEAFFLAQNGRPGPILIDIPKDVSLENFNNYSYKKIQKIISKKDYIIEYFTNENLIKKFLLYLTESYQPLLYIGGGVIRSNAFKVLQELAKIFKIPVSNTLMGKSAYNENDNLSLGMVGMHGSAFSNIAISECDTLICLGARFDDRVTGKLEEFASNAEVVHIDIDPIEIAKNRCPQLSLIGDLKKILKQTLKIIHKSFKFNTIKRDNWLKRIYTLKKTYPLISTNSYLKNKKSLDNELSSKEVIHSIGSYYKEAFYTSDVGIHQMLCAQLINCEPKKWISSSGLGTMGFGLPAAIGTKIANPKETIICITGDSSFQMCIQELGTISQYNLIIKVIIINNSYMGMVRQWQESFYENRFSNSYMKNGMPNFIELAAAYGIKGKDINNFDEFNKHFQNNNKNKSITEESIIININVKNNENCYPMIIPGKSNSCMLGLE